MSDEGNLDKWRKYRASTLGQTFGQTLLSLIAEKEISKGEASSMLDIFDECINTRVKTSPLGDVNVESATIECDLDYYNCYDGLWRIRVKNASVRGIAAHETSSITVLADETMKLKPKKRKR
jgi:hypothetical protein